MRDRRKQIAEYRSADPGCTDLPDGKSSVVIGPGDRIEKAARAKGNFLNGFNVIWVVQPSSKKYSALAVGQIKSRTRAILSREEGRWPSSRTLGQVAVDAGGAKDERTSCVR